MSEVITLLPRGPSRPVAAVGSAEILFFTGVRYHRMSDEEFAKATAKTPRAAKVKTARQFRRLA